ncbi:MAG: hypothetical protein U0441_32650 [Polyangiaceae bacterium]
MVSSQDPDDRGATAREQPVTPREDAAPSFVVEAHSRATRALAIGLYALAAANVVYLGAALAGDFTNGTESAPPVPLAMGLLLFSALPVLIAAVLRRAATGTLTLRTDTLTLALRSERIDIPLASVTRIRPLALPWPTPAVALDLRSGRTFDRALGARTLPALVSALSRHVPLEKKPILSFAASVPEKRSRWLLSLQHVVLPLALTLVIFRLHQIIVYGGPFGQYHSMGLGPYVGSFIRRWLGIAGAFAVMAGVLRIVVELTVWGLTVARPGAARALRRVAEILALVLYFGAIPGYVAVRLLLD